jgi:hypothetical protein
VVTDELKRQFADLSLQFSENLSVTGSMRIWNPSSINGKLSKRKSGASSATTKFLGGSRRYASSVL